VVKRETLRISIGNIRPKVYINHYVAFALHIIAENITRITKRYMSTEHTNEMCIFIRKIGNCFMNTSPFIHA
jgi:hypothetical protein